jgi:hypothetical protein
MGRCPDSAQEEREHPAIPSFSWGYSFIRLSPQPGALADLTGTAPGDGTARCHGLRDRGIARLRRADHRRAVHRGPMMFAVQLAVRLIGGGIAGSRAKPVHAAGEVEEILARASDAWLHHSDGITPVLAATLSAHGSAAFDVDVLAGLGGDVTLRRRGVRSRCCRGWRAGGRARR